MMLFISFCPFFTFINNPAAEVNVNSWYKSQESTFGFIKNHVFIYRYLIFNVVDLPLDCVCMCLWPGPQVTCSFLPLCRDFLFFSPVPLFLLTFPTILELLHSSGTSSPFAAPRLPSIFLLFQFTPNLLCSSWTRMIIDIFSSSHNFFCCCHNWLI